ncbi:MAG: TraM recognition domain-containing protein [Armatimonadota bacterium]|nr:TraM recognition domain-containing protein [Armatimonadota bacterium]
MAVVGIDRIGDLNDTLIARCAAAGIRPERLIIIDAGDPEWVIPWNPFLQPGDACQIADGFVAAIERRWPCGVQVQFDLKNICHALVINRQSPLEIVRMFSDDEFRARITSNVSDAWLRSYFVEFEGWTREQRAQRQSAVSNKLQTFLSNPRVRRMLCGKGTLDLRKIIDDPSAILLVTLRKDLLHDCGDLVGDMVIQGIWNAVRSRSTIPEAQRVKSTLILDEGQNFAKGCLDEIITEGRRYGLRLIFAHQSQAQIDEKLRAIMRNNCAVQVVFNVGIVDAREMSPILMPMTREEATDAILRLEVGEAFVLRRAKYPAKVLTPNAKAVNMSLAHAFRRKSMIAHGQRCQEIDAEIASRWQVGEKANDKKQNDSPEVRHVRKPRR